MLTRCVLACMCALLLDIAVVTSNASPIEIFSEIDILPKHPQTPGCLDFTGEKKMGGIFFHCLRVAHSFPFDDY